MKHTSMKQLLPRKYWGIIMQNSFIQAAVEMYNLFWQFKMSILIFKPCMAASCQDILQKPFKENSDLISWN